MDAPADHSQQARTFYRRCVAAAAGITALAAVLIRLDGAPAAAMLMDVSFMVVPALAGLACVRRASRHSVDRHAWLWLGGACFVWATGGAAWTYEGALYSHDHAFPALADLAWTAYAVPAFVGLTLLRSRSLANRSWLWWLLDASVIATAVLFISWTTVLGDLVDAPSAGQLGRIVVLAYPAVDVILISLVLALGMRNPPGTRGPWVLLGAGFTTLCLADSVYVRLVLDNSYEGGGLFDVSWIIAFVLVGLAAYAPSGTRAGDRGKRISVAQELLPYLPVFAVVVVALVAPMAVGKSPFLLWLGILLLVLVAFRQVVVVWEKTALVHDMDRLVQERTNEVEAQRQFLAAVLESLEDGVVACDVDGVMTVFNDATRIQHGLPATAIPNEKWADHYRLRRADGVTPLPTDEIPLLRALAGGRVGNQEFVIAPDGERRRLIRANGRAISGLQGEPLGAVVALHDITDSRRAQLDLEHQAFHDTLTGMGNRACLDEGLTAMLLRGQSRNEPIALLLVDLDNFKQINDLFGHAAGDALLVEVSRRLCRCVRGRDLSVRLGGDEFVFVLENTTPTRAAAVAARMLAELSKPIMVVGAEVVVQASIGVSEGGPGGASRAVLRGADLAMYEAKHTGGNAVVIFDPSMQVLADARLSLESDMRTGLRDGEFHLVYQPVVDLVTGAVTGVEALCRWNPPGRDPVPPSDFIPVAEQTGLIVPLGEWVLLEAYRQLLLWDEALPHGPRLTMAVNVSLAQLDSPGFLLVLENLLATTRLKPKRVVIEITESALRDDARTSTVLQAFHDLGVGVSIDDFGTGYSSLSRLHNTSVDNVKLDRSFVTEITEEGSQVPILEAMVTMAGVLGLSTIAEGIETTEQLDYLRSLGCDRGQGFLMSKPLPAGAVLAYLRTAPWRPADVRVQTVAGSPVLHGGGPPLPPLSHTT